MNEPSRRARRLVVVYNPAGGGADRLDEVRDAFAERDVEVEWVPTTAEDPGIGMARRAVEERASAVVAAGGDGTVRCCAEGLMGSGVPLGVIPTGTGNLLARSLGIPLDVAEAVDVVLDGVERAIDIGLANDEPFVVMAGMGLDARMIEDSDPELKSKIGPLAYVASAFRHLRREPFTVALALDDEVVGPFPATMVLVGNLGELPGGVSPFRDADPEDGLLEVLIIQASGLFGWLRAVGAVLVGRQRRDVRQSAAPSLTIETITAQPYEVDGDERDRTRRLEFSLRPKALCCIVPPLDD